MRLQGKVCVVTGGASGIGEGCARAFVREGARVYILDVNEERGRRVAAEAGCTFIRADVRSESDLAAAAAQVEREAGVVHVLVNSAGVAFKGAVDTTPLAEWERVIDINLTGPYLASRAFYPLLAKPGASVIHIGSIGSFIGIVENAAYCSSKGGLMGLTRNMAIDWAPKGIRVNCLCPTMIMTPMLEDYIKQQPDPDEYVRQVSASIPLGYIGTPEDVAGPAVFLASDESRYMTGSALMVDGGYTAR